MSLEEIEQLFRRPWDNNDGGNGNVNDNDNENGNERESDGDNDDDEETMIPLTEAREVFDDEHEEGTC